MIRVELGEEIKKHGIFRYHIVLEDGRRLTERRSHQPLLDACYQVKCMGQPTSGLAGLFREGRTNPDLTCDVEWGATHVCDNSRFAKRRSKR
jgi:hypothetical protein